MKKIKVLIADDSAVYRSQIRTALQELPFVEVIGTASNGRLAIERINQNCPDLLILDLEMPEVDGLQTLIELNQGLNFKVLVFSSLSVRGAEITMEALRLGARDFITKPSGAVDADALGNTPLNPAEKIKGLLLPKIKGLFPEYIENRTKPSTVKRVEQFPSANWELLKPKVILIGASTGGPTVIEEIVAKFNSPLKCPIVIAVHMPPIFTTTFAERLSKFSGLPASEPTQGEVLKANHIYIAPGDYHLRLRGSPDRIVADLDRGPQINSVRPAVDALFASAAPLFKEKCLAFVLTGMGADGRDGCVAVKNSGGTVVIQDEDSCVVFGMPGAVLLSGAYDKIAAPHEIVEMINEKVGAYGPAQASAV